MLFYTQYINDSLMTVDRIQTNFTQRKYQCSALHKYPVIKHVINANRKSAPSNSIANIQLLQLNQAQWQTDGHKTYEMPHHKSSRFLSPRFAFLSVFLPSFSLVFLPESFFFGFDLLSVSTYCRIT